MSRTLLRILIYGGVLIAAFLFFKEPFGFIFLEEQKRKQALERERQKEQAIVARILGERAKKLQSKTGRSGTRPPSRCKKNQIEADFAATEGAAESAHQAWRASTLECLDRSRHDSRLHAASALGLLTRLESLVYDASDVDSRDGAGRTPLMLAVRSARADDVALLLGAGADVNRQDNKGRSPLHWLARSADNDRIAMQLLEAGADLQIETSRGVSAEKHVGRVLDDSTEVLLMLAKRGNGDWLDKAMSAALGSGEVEQVDRVLNQGGSPDTLIGRQRQPALIRALLNRDRPIVDRLVQAGADPNSMNASGVSAFRLALTNGYLDTARALLDRGAVESLVSVSSIDPVRLLARAGSTHEQVRGLGLLKEIGVVLDAPAANRPSLLVTALGWGNVELVRALIAAGADVNRLSPGFETPLSYLDSVQPFNHARLQQLLLQSGAESDLLKVVRQQSPDSARNCDAGARISFSPADDLTREDTSTRGIDLMIENIKDPELRRQMQKQFAAGSIDAVTRRLNACSRWIGRCLREGGFSLDDCVLSAPICLENEDNCCPARCQARYGQARCAGMPGENALQWALRDRCGG